MNEHPRLLGMTLENHMGLDLTELEFDLKTHVVKVSGKNESGKTRLIGSVPYALGVKGFTPEEPITHGRTTGRVFLSFDAFTVERVAKKGQPTRLVVKKKGDDKPISSPQAFLDALIPPVVMNPTDFCTKFNDKQRLDSLYDILGNREAIEKLDRESAEVYESRKIVNRDVTALKGKLSGFSEDDEECPGEVSIANLLARRTRAEEADRKIEERHTWIRKAEESIAKYEYSVTTMRAQITELEKSIETALAAVDTVKNQITEQQSIIDAAPESIVPAIDAQLQSLEATNAMSRAAESRNQTRAELRKKTSESDKATRRLRAIEEEKIELLTSANIPIKGLTIEDQQIKVNGLPWTQQSTAQGLLNAMRLINMKNAALRHMIVDWNVLDMDARKIVVDFAEENGYLVFAEVVANTKEQAIEQGALFLEDGVIVK